MGGSCVGRPFDPRGHLLFLSDGNLALARSLGVCTYGPELVLGETSTRFMLIVERGIVTELNVEKKLTDLSYTRARDAALAA